MQSNLKSFKHPLKPHKFVSKSTKIKIKIKINFYTSWKKLQNKQIILIK